MRQNVRIGKIPCCRRCTDFYLNEGTRIPQSETLATIWRASLAYCVKGKIRPGSAEAYVAAAVLVGVASLIRWGFGHLDPEILPFTTYYPAVLLATIIGGSGAGAFGAIVGGIIGWWAFMSPFFASFTFPLFEPLPLKLGQGISFLIYLFASLLIVWGADRYRRLAKRLQDEESLRKLAVEELGHRLKNKTATLQSIISYQLRESPQLRNEISNRFIALSRTDDLIMATQGQGVHISNILSTELGPYELSRISMHGADFLLPPTAALTMALLVHELATNAAKHGALSSAVGKLTIRWTLADRTFNLDWRESGGPLITSPTYRGFGLRLLSRALDQFDGTVKTTFEKTGLVCEIKATLPECTPNIDRDESHGHSAAA
jgi:two-component sensor histidine kinase